MKTPTIYDIKYATQATETHFFDHKTMKFFGQTLKDFSVRQSPGGRIFIYAPMYDKHNFGRVRLIGYTFREFVDGKLVIPHDDQGNTAPDNNLSDIYGYIAAH